MKITKYHHSCLLIEEQEKTILLDPGNYSYNENALNIASLNRLDFIGITHEHPDHMYIPWIKEIINKFPKAQIFSNESVKDILEKEGIKIKIEENDFIKMTLVPHERIWTGIMPKNVMFTLFDKLVDPGDSLSFNLADNQPLLVKQGNPSTSSLHSVIQAFGSEAQARKDDIILALPITAPWGSTTHSVEKALETKPKYIIPIHDWQWKDDIREGIYNRLESYFFDFGIKFLKPQTGIPIELKFIKPD